MAQVITGAKAAVYINDALIGFIGGVSVNQEQELTDVDVLGQLEVGDLAETSHKCSFTFNYFKAADDVLGQTQTNNTAAFLLLDTTGSQGTNSMRNQTEFNVTVYNDETDEPIYTMQGAKWAGGSGSVNARGVWEGQWSFKARRGFGL